MADAQSVAESVFREESGRIVSSLIRISGSFDRAEEAMQEALAAALASWPLKGVPDNPPAWIMATAHRKLIDTVRREHTRREKWESLSYTARGSVVQPDITLEAEPMHLPDDRLRLIFTCCHPALNREAQIALTLRTLGGLSTSEIAKAFLLPEATLAQRIVRSKRKIQEARIPYEVPPPDRLPERLESVQSVVYLIFNEGYTATTAPGLVRKDLCREAIRLGRLLCELLPVNSENAGLLALMLLQDSRREARLVDGELVTLDEQNRAAWDAEAIAEGLQLIETALRRGPVGPYQLQAAIAAVHSQAKAPSDTDWCQISALYARLHALHPSPVIALNHAVAVAMSEGYSEGLRRIDKLGVSGALDHYYLLHAARADLLRRTGNRLAAIDAYERAISLASNPIEQRYLRRRLQDLQLDCL